MEPWGTPEVTVISLDSKPRHSTYCFLSVKYDLNKLNSGKDKPDSSSFRRRMA